MQEKLKTFIYIILILGIGGGIYGYLEFNRTATSTENLRSEFNINVADLVAAYLQDETTANEKYLGKIISATGTVQFIEESVNGGITIILASADGSATINGLVEKGKEATFKDFQPGNEITLRGSVSGFDDLFGEVKLANCVLLGE